MLHLKCLSLNWDCCQKWGFSTITGGLFCMRAGLKRQTAPVYKAKCQFITEASKVSPAWAQVCSPGCLSKLWILSDYRKYKVRRYYLNFWRTPENVTSKKLLVIKVLLPHWEVPYQLDQLIFWLNCHFCS